MSLPNAIQRHPQLDEWLSINEDGTITVRTGKVEIGQGIKTSLAMIAAEELDVSPGRIRVQTADTELTPDEQVTSGSMSVQDSGSALRVACAVAREVMLALAAESLEVDAATLQVADGLISSEDSNEQTDYWTIQAGHPFHVAIQDSPAVKEVHRYSVVGRKQIRIDLPDKALGRPTFVHDLTLPHMRHGRLVKPPSPHAELLECPETLNMQGVEVVRDGSFVGVVAATEALAVLAMERLRARCRWQSAPLRPMPDDMPSYLRERVSESLVLRGGKLAGEAAVMPPQPANAATTLQASYYRPYQMHASLGPSAAVAHYENGRLTVYTHSQGIELLKQALAEELELPEDEVHLLHVEGSGCYGHNGADDVALDAALLARAAEPFPVNVKWTRSDEHGNEPFGPPAVMDLQASLDGDGQVIDWRHEVFSCSHIGRPRPTPGYSNMQAAWLRANAKSPAPRKPIPWPEVCIHRNLQPMYEFADTHLVEHFVADSPLRTSALRSLGAFANVFAIESFMDELAAAVAQEPIQFRLKHLADARARKVLQRLEQELRKRPVAAGSGRGVAMARYKNQQTWCAIGVDVIVDDRGHVQLEHAVIVADAGLVIDPDGLANQLEGGFIQAASWTLKEEVLWDEEGITTLNWESYPILRFGEVPRLETHLVAPNTGAALGAGEASTGPTPAAIANAIYRATGLRARHLPITPERLRMLAAL